MYRGAWLTLLLSPLTACTLDADALVRDAPLTVDVEGVASSVDHLALDVLEGDRVRAALEAPFAGGAQQFIVTRLPPGAFAIQLREYAGVAMARCSRHVFPEAPASRRAHIQAGSGSECFDVQRGSNPPDAGPSGPEDAAVPPPRDASTAGRLDMKVLEEDKDAEPHEDEDDAHVEEPEEEES